LLWLFACSEYGIHESVFTDVFEQGEETSSDLLFVVDDSASMSEEQAQLADAFGALVEAVEETGADFRIGIVTTDVSGETAGAMRGDLLTPDTDDLEGAFLEQALAGTDGDKDEQGLEAARLAVELAEGFPRDDAGFHVAFFSDEDDHSPDEVDAYVDDLAWVAGEDFAIHAVVGDLPYGCIRDGAAADAGTRYVTAALASDGFRESICASDYDGILERIGLGLSGRLDTFVLDHVAEESSLEVEVDDLDGEGWAFDVGANAVVFEREHVPEPGAVVSIRYELLAGADG